jgi:hypothetical protein
MKEIYMDEQDRQDEESADWRFQIQDLRFEI